MSAEVSECGQYMCRVNNSWDMCCNAAKGHVGPHSYTTEFVPLPTKQSGSAEVSEWMRPCSVELCRELYDRFVMGGWEPQDAHDEAAEIIARHCPSAAAPLSIEQFFKHWPEIGNIPQALKVVIFRFAEGWRKANESALASAAPVYNQAQPMQGAIPSINDAVAYRQAEESRQKAEWQERQGAIPPRTPPEEEGK